MCKRTENGLTTICFPDFGLADYNAALLHPDFTPGRRETIALMKQISRALPKAALLKLEKIPAMIGNRQNPLVQMSELDYHTPSASILDIAEGSDTRPLADRIKQLEKAMRDAARRLEFEEAAMLRDKLRELRELQIYTA